MRINAETRLIHAGDMRTAHHADKKGWKEYASSLEKAATPMPQAKSDESGKQFERAVKLGLVF